MSTIDPAAAPQVRPDSHLTLHYRISLAQTGADVVSTFGGRPATLQIGIGQLAEALERCLLGLSEGAHQSFELAPVDAFGARNPELIQTLSRGLLDERSQNGETFVPGDLVDFPSPDGGRFTGVLKELGPQRVVFDFNHPLAGQAIVFEVQILGIL